MNIEKIEINGHYVWVDKDAEIKEGDWMIRPNENPILVTPTFWWDFGVKYDKIIASSPELNLEGIPTYVEWLAEQEYPIKKGGSMWMPSRFDLDQSNKQEGFIKGYQKAEKELQVEQRVKDLEKRLYDCSKTNADLIGKINELPTWDDVRKAISMARETEYGLIKSKDEIIEQLKQDKK